MSVTAREFNQRVIEVAVDQAQHTAFVISLAASIGFLILLSGCLSALLELELTLHAHYGIKHDGA